MDWEPWREEGWLAPADDGGRDSAMLLVREAWKVVISARAAYLENDWERMDSEIRRAFVAATDALLKRAEFNAAREFDFETSIQLGRDVFGEQMIDAIRERALIARSMMPLAPEISPKDARLVRRSVAASSEYVAIVDSHCLR